MISPAFYVDASQCLGIVVVPGSFNVSLDFTLSPHTERYTWHSHISPVQLQAMQQITWGQFLTYLSFQEIKDLHYWIKEVCPHFFEETPAAVEAHVSVMMVDQRISFKVIRVRR